MFKIPYNCKLMVCFLWFMALFHVLYTYEPLSPPSNTVSQCTIIISVAQMKRLRHREVKEVA